MIHIMDTEHPWDVYSISSGHAEVISCLEWDQSGQVTKLSKSFAATPFLSKSRVRSDDWSF